MNDNVILVTKISTKGKAYIACYSIDKAGEWVFLGYANSTNVSNTLKKFAQLKGGK